MAPTRILLVEDSDIFAELFAHAAAAAADVELVGRAADGAQGVVMANKLQPDVVLMDVQMPKKNGIEATREIRRNSNVPVLVMSAVGKSQEATMCFDAMKAGATDFVAKPSDDRQFRRLVTRLKLVSTSLAPSAKTRARADQQLAVSQPLSAPTTQAQVVAIASSTGGPAALAKILPGLPKDFPLPVVIVQHMSEGFEQNLVDWLDHSSAVRVKLAVEGERPLPGHVYIASPGAHLVFDRRRAFRLDSQTPPREGHSPSGSVLFHSMVGAYGAECLAVVLTGMGDDGSDGLLALRNAGATTLVQDAASSTIDGMPKSARDNGAAMVVRPLDQIAAAICSLTSVKLGATAQRSTQLGA